MRLLSGTAVNEDSTVPHRVLIKKCFNGTEGGSRTHTVSPPPDFESGASTNSATPAQAAIITKKSYDATISQTI